MRWFPLLLSIVLPLAAVGFGLEGMPGAILAGIFGVIILLLAAMVGERLIIGIFPIRSELIRHAPRALIIADPAPWAIAVRSVGSQGTILLSQGLTSLLEDDEIDRILEAGKRRLRSRRILLQTTCATFAAWILRFTPHGWLGLASRREGDLGAGALIHFLAVLPMLRYFDRMAKSATRAGPAPSANALHKIGRIQDIWRSQALPGISALSLLE